MEFPQRGKTATSRIHRKYVYPEKEGQKYLRIGPSQGRNADGVCDEWGGSAMLDSWIAEAAGHANDEKKHIDALLDRSPKVIDLEIALPARHRGESAPRIDLAALEDPSDGHPARVVFWEVQRLNDARLRSTSVPKVIEQLLAYVEYVCSDPQLFKDAYRKTCRILNQLHDIACRGWGSPRPPDRLLSDVANGERLQVDVEPRLLIIKDEAPKRNWEHHRKRLTDCLGERVHFARPGEAIPRGPRRPT